MPQMNEEDERLKRILQQADAPKKYPEDLYAAQRDNYIKQMNVEKKRKGCRRSPLFLVLLLIILVVI